MKRKTIYEVGEEIRRSQIPALIMVGDEDESCLAPGLFMKRRMPAAGLTIFPKSGHCINLEEPALFNQLVQDFLHAVENGRWPLRGEVTTSLLPADTRG